jgi:hypothetical protein
MDVPEGDVYIVLERNKLIVKPQYNIVVLKN